MSVFEVMFRFIGTKLYNFCEMLLILPHKKSLNLYFSGPGGGLKNAKVTNSLTNHLSSCTDTTGSAKNILRPLRLMV